MAFEKGIAVKADGFNNLNLTRGKRPGGCALKKPEEKDTYTLRLYFQQRDRTNANDKGRPIDKIEETFREKPMVIRNIKEGTTLLQVIRDLEKPGQPVSNVKFIYDGKPDSVFPDDAPYFAGCRIMGKDFYGSEINKVINSDAGEADGGRSAGFRWKGVNWLYFIGRPAISGEYSTNQEYPDERLSQFVFNNNNKYIRSKEVSITLSFEKMSFIYEIQFLESDKEFQRVYIIKSLPQIA